MKKEKEEEKEVELPKKKEKIIKEKDPVKKQMISLVIGILIGVIIATCIFLIARPKATRCVPNIQQFSQRERVQQNKDSKRNFYQERNKNNQDEKVEDKESVPSSDNETKNQG